MLRASDYNIYIKAKNHEDMYLFLHGYTGAVDLVSGDIYRCFVEGAGNPQKFDELNPEFIGILVNRGYLTGKSINEEREIFSKVADSIQEFKEKYIEITLIPTYNCNFRCPYCFEKYLSKNGNQWLEKTMDKETVDLAFRRIEALIRNGKIVTDINIYGGEPLLKENYEIIEYIVQKGVGAGMRMKCITNGFEFEYFKDLIGDNGISHLQFTIDGLEEMHNSRRFLAGKKPSFGTIVSNIDLALKLGAFVNLRTNIDKTNLDQMEGLLNFFDEKGWTQNSRFYSYFKSVHGCYNPKEKEQINETHIMNKLKECKLKDHRFKYNSVYWEIADTFIRVFQSNKFNHLKSSYCGAVNGSLAIDPFAQIFPCLEMVGKEGASVGTLDHEGNFRFDDSYRYWRDRKTQKLGTCSECAYALFCGGGCPAYSGPKSKSDLENSYCNHFIEIFREVVPEVYSVIEESMNVKVG